jgi:predicted Zn-ribbon and HTH transcriptional regulator
MTQNQRKRIPKVGLAPRNCESCGAEFQPYRSSQIHCTRRCRDNGPSATATRQAYLARPEVKERMLARRRVSTAPDPEVVRLYNLRGAMKRYGVTLDWYEAKLVEQDGRCAACGATPDPNGIKAASRLHVDHDHVTGTIRDLLCVRCNQGLGYFGDDPALLRAAADYIERHRRS